ncbi:MAG TPA: SH3 domain-containing protein [Candidatus Dormibacteraeota bacterium]|nr:SH3 domain-containing protein [Candidatus Dormibacteraeota bacterium]
MAIGAVAAFLLAGPLTSLYKTHAVASRPQLSASPTIDPHASPTSCPASLPMPKSAPTVTPPSPPALPFTIWVNEPLGAKLRAGASASSGQLAILSQGTQATADQRAPDASGNVWYHVKAATLAGWVRSDLIAVTPLQAASGVGWSLMLPQGYQVTPSSDPSSTTVLKSGDDLPFLVLQTSSTDTLTVHLPAQLRADMAPVADHTTAVQVWNYTPLTEQVSRVALDTCKVTSAWARPDQGWPFMASVYVHTKGRNYQFSFFTADANSPVVKQVLDSVALS